MENRMNLEGLSFDDVFIRPARTGIAPNEVSLESYIVRGHISSIPVIPAPMTGIYSQSLRKALDRYGIPTPLPREAGSEDRDTLLALTTETPTIATTSPFRADEVEALLDHPKVDYVILDTVAAHNDRVCSLLDTLGPRSLEKVIVGNIATREAAADFAPYNLAALKVGLGPGSICTTSAVTGIGVPQLQAIAEVAEILRGTNTSLIADGGIRSPGDIAKAIAAGADGVMMGRMFAATTESDGAVTVVDGIEYKLYEGSKYATIELAPDYSDAELNSQIKKLHSCGNHRSEGVSGLIRHSGPVALLLEHLARSLRASFAFVGAQDIKEFRERARFQRVTPAAYAQGGAHSIDIISKHDQLTRR